MTRLILGEPVPWFDAPTPSNPRFHFSSVAGRYILLAFLPADPAARAQALAAVEAHRSILDDVRITSFMVVRDEPTFRAASDGRGVRWFFDADAAVSRLYGSLAPDGNEAVVWYVIDPSLRLLMRSDLSGAELVFQRLRGLPSPDDHAGVPLHAPVLIVPRVFEPDVCRQLIDQYETVGGQASGVMRDIGGRTVGVLDDFKKRRDAAIADEGLKAALRARVARRLLPEIERAFQFAATRIERYIVACYDAEEGGYFRAHRDNTTKGTAHRKFAVSINLNAEGFEGGDLRFPEYGSRTYRPPTGGAVVFSCALLHEATPVTRGRRYTFLPFLFDEAGERIRRDNLHALALAPEAATTVG